MKPRLSGSRGYTASVADALVVQQVPPALCFDLVESQLAASSSNVQVCGYCRRTSRMVCPCPKRYGSTVVTFTSKTSALCCGCGNYQHACCKGSDKKQLKEALKDEDPYKEYCGKVAAYEQLLESSIGKQVRNALDRVGAPDCLRLIKESSDDAILNFGVFWPVPVFVAEEGKEPNPEDLTDFVFHGKKLRGVYRSKTCGEPPGTITRGAGQHEKILQIRDMAPEKASEGFKKIADQTVHGHSVTMKKDDATGEASYMPVQKKTKLKAADVDDELDWSDIRTTGGTSTVTYEDSSSDTDSSPKRKKKKKKAAKSPATRINSKWMTGQRKEATPTCVKKTVPKTSPKT